ncbi:DUF5011 domain-containing protein [Polaribacter sp.]|nr:DUF5011 domain-containing protein [Polaribacter sp.]
MKLVLKNSKLIVFFLMAIIYAGCSEDVVELPKITAGFTYTLNENTGTVEFINISENATTYSWDFGDETPLVSELISSDINPIKTYINGTYTVILKAMNAAGAVSYFEDIIVVGPIQVGPDTTIPVITLTGLATIEIDVNESFTDQGATATDAVDGDISENIVVGGDIVDTTTAGTYVITYNVSDAADNEAVEVTRTVNVNTVVVGLCTADVAQTLTAVNFHLTFQTDPGTIAVKNSENFKFFQDNVTYEYADNPAVSAGNNSCKVAKVINHNAAAWDNLQFDFANKLIFTDGSNFTIKVYSPQSGYKVTLKLEDKANSGAFKQVASGVTTKTDEWEELTISFNASDSDKYDKVVFFFDLETKNGNTYYFDDLKLNLGTGGGGGGTGGGSSNTVGGGDGCADTTTCPDAPTGELLFNGDFEACDCDWQLIGNGGTVSISETIDNGGSRSAQIQSASGKNPALKQERLGVGIIQPNTTYVVTFDIKASGAFGEGGVFKAFVFSEGENGGDVPATKHDLTIDTSSISSTSWESKSYTFTTPGNANQVAGGVSFLAELVNSNASVNIDNVVIKAQ